MALNAPPGTQDEMGKKSKRRAVKGRVAQIDLVLAEGGLVLSVGPISVWLDLEDARDLAETLVQALSVEAEGSEGRESVRSGQPPGRPGKRRPN